MKNLRTNSALFGSIQAKDSNGLRLQDDGGNGIFIKDGGNIGIGTTNPSQKLEVAGHLFVNDGQAIFKRNSVVSGPFYAEQEGSGPAGVFMGGNVGIGTRNPESRLTIQSESEDAVDAITLKYEHLTSTALGKEKRIKWRFGDDATANAFSDAGYIAVGKASSWSDSGSRSSYLSFATTLSNTQSEAMRIHSNGQVGIGTTASIGSEKLIVFRGTSSAGNGLQRWNSNIGSSANTVAIMYADGDLSLDGAVTENLSDIRLKENIVDATPKLDDLMKLEVKNFNLIDDNRKKKRIGFIAQEMEKVFPSLVKTFDSRKYDEDGNVISGYEDAKTVRVKMDFAILTKAIQEQQQIIEDLKSQNESLAARITALEG